MKVFETTNDNFRLIAYDSFDENLYLRHQKWCQTKDKTEKSIYIVFFLQNDADKKSYKSARLDNVFCIVYFFDEPKSKEWIEKFCTNCYVHGHREW